MADRLTQLQDCLDQLAYQMFATLNYTTINAGSSPIPGQPLPPPLQSASPTAPAFPPGSAPQTQPSATQGTTQVSSSSDPTQTTHVTSTTTSGASQSQPQDPEAKHAAFTADLHELARDLIIKEQQIEYLISVLPGVGSSEREQRERMRKLEVELREVEAERIKAVEERERLLQRLGRVIGEIRL